jgi:hypothetical protein
MPELAVSAVAGLFLQMVWSQVAAGVALALAGQAPTARLAEAYIFMTLISFEEEEEATMAVPVADR